MVKNRALIARNYLCSGRLLLDVIASVPLDLFTLFWSIPDTVFLLKLLKITRIYRLSNIIYYMRTNETRKTWLRLAKLIVFIVLYLHLLACSWNMLVSIEEKWVPSTDTIIADQYRFYSEHHWFRYTFSFYIAVSTLVGIEILPLAREELLFCAFWIMVGALLFAYILGEIAYLVITLNRFQVQYFEKFDQIHATMGSLKLEGATQRAVEEYFFNTFSFRNRHFEWESLKTIIPNSLLKEINLVLYKNILRFHEIFSHYPELVEETIRDFAYSFLSPETNLMETAQDSEFFCFIVAGHCTVWVEGTDSREVRVRTLHSGEYCGEVGIIYNVKRTARVTALDYCNAGKLGKTEFLGILRKYPALEKELKLQITKYNDPYKRQITVSSTQKMINKISYFNGLSPLLIDSVFYSLQPLSLDEDQTLFEQGSVAKSVYFIIEGCVYLGVNVYDSQILNHLRHGRTVSDTKLQTLLTLKQPKRESCRRKSIKRFLNPNSQSQLSLCKLTNGSLLCANQAILQCKMHCHAFTALETKLLVLTEDSLRNLCNENIPMKMKINLRKMKYTQFNRQTNEPIVLAPVIDCHKHFKFETPGEIRSWKVRKRLKNAALMVVIRNRYRVPSTVFSLKMFRKRLKAVWEAENRGWHHLARMIERGEIGYKSIKYASLLTAEELKTPVFSQFTSLLHKTQKTAGGVKTSNLSILEKLGALDSEAQSIHRSTTEMGYLFDELTKHINSI